ncbi:MAG: hypothetical protein AW08_03552 [Candidatus Accumulibacter adjunctus]|uniref:Uncharacterized protein n=1 Tax=Candidatus Accumulibacter adjunctus TaxID=1454001 RepID=A0A011MR06_9PROT|nr:MAG: hypothetical protein AW08_03552 [Candidatus Accumulibacter adjunctus]
MQFGDPLRDGEAEATAIAAGLAATMEAFGKARQFVRVDPRPVVGHGERHFPRLAADKDRDPRFVRGMPQGVVEQRAQRDLEQFAVAAD